MFTIKKKKYGHNRIHLFHTAFYNGIKYKNKNYNLKKNVSNIVSFLTFNSLRILSELFVLFYLFSVCENMLMKSSLQIIDPIHLIHDQMELKICKHNGIQKRKKNLAIK